MKSKSLSPQVQEHLTNAISELRSALWHAARNEQPATLTQISSVINDIDKIATVADIMNHLEDMKSRGDTKWSDFLGDEE